MSFRRLIAASVVAGTLLVGGASASAAAESPPRPPASAECRGALRRVADLRTFDARLRHELAQMARLRAAAVRAGNDELVAKVDARIARLRAGRAKVAEQLAAAMTVVREECPARPTAAS